jgi:hypothetical protein
MYEMPQPPSISIYTYTRRHSIVNDLHTIAVLKPPLPHLQGDPASRLLEGAV